MLEQLLVVGFISIRIGNIFRFFLAVTSTVRIVSDIYVLVWLINLLFDICLRANLFLLPSVLLSLLLIDQLLLLMRVVTSEVQRLLSFDSRSIAV